jgi:adenosylmethionine---8-amino-7-oxononanoate aminotransferase
MNIWHPYTQHKTALLPIEMVRGEGTYLYDNAGNQYLDAISSWWVTLHGHAHPVLAEAIASQAKILEQVIFAGFTHPQAQKLANNLLSILPKNQQKVFFSDDGSTAVEVGLKMAFQYWHNQGITHKTRLIALNNAYHGDTFGAMAVGERGGFTAPFAPFLFEVDFVPAPTKGNKEKSLSAFENLLKTNQVAGFIFEPLVQGAGGMAMYSPEMLDKMLDLCKEYHVITIADEVMTGFGRTGKLFASLHLERNMPDIFCLSKGLTGGFLPLGITTATQKIFDAFWSDSKLHTLFHGHSFTANPIACAVANASFELLISENCEKQRQNIINSHQNFLEKIKNHSLIAEVRQQGTILAIEIKTQEKTSYFNNIRDILYNFFMEKKIILRPLGNVVYILPPYCISKEDLERVYDVIEQGLNEL